ncbi:myotubularin [Cryptococcus neoformans Ze90-1]|nr:myotubularin [Cryptococcus neoformans var. grubii Ze90-1]
MDALRVARVDNVTIQYFLPPTAPDQKPTPLTQIGQLHLTPHHLIFSHTPSTAYEPEIWIPYPLITRLTRLPQTINGLYPLQVETKTFESYVLLFAKDRDDGAEEVWQSVKDCSVKSSVEQLYAFFYVPPSPGTGWTVFNHRTEFARQGLGTRTKAWRFTDINKDYSFSPTYPSKLVVPSRISDSTLMYAGKYRSKARIPALTYLHWANNASITRSSQPMVGIKNSRSSQDERLVECIFSSHMFLDNAYSSAPIFGATSTNLIIDARPTTNAMANVAMGAGTENMENYKLGKKAYLGIDNIHVMRNSLKTVAEAIREANLRPSVPLNRALLRKSNWLRHISTILDGALIIVRNIHLNASHVLIHCSDGWDRTGQLSAVAQICLDPYYRTFDGFKVLVEKDWLAFGHKFLDRSGHLSSEKYFMVTENDDDMEEEGVSAQRAAQAFFATVQKQFTSTSHLKEISPVFHQFLDCVRQIQRQFPERFEFNEQYLLDIYRHLYTCQFGTFLFNNERERQGSASTSRKSFVEQTCSVWDYLDSPSEREKHINSLYDTTLDSNQSRDARADQGVLFYNPKDVRFWFRLFGRGDEEMNGSSLTLNQPQGVDIIGPIGGDQVEDMAAGEILRGASPVSAPSPHATTSQSRSWNWSQLSGNALNAVHSAAREIKSISQDALSQIRAEANELDRESWEQEGKGKNSEPASLTESTLLPETNPWSAEARSSPTIPPPRPNTQVSRTTQNPWAAMPDTITSLSNLTLDSKTPGSPANDTGTKERAGEKQQKAWDPLGAL